MYISVCMRVTVCAYVYANNVCMRVPVCVRMLCACVCQCVHVCARVCILSFFCARRHVGVYQCVQKCMLSPFAYSSLGCLLVKYGVENMQSVDRRNVNYKGDKCTHYDSLDYVPIYYHSTRSKKLITIRWHVMIN